jgi:hypothetical protein
LQIQLRNYMRADRGWGSAEGRQVNVALLTHVHDNPQETVFRISLEGVRQTDTSFARESVILLGKRFIGQRGFCLTDVTDEDVLDNWDAVARKEEYPLLVWNGNCPRLIGKQPSEGLKAIFNFVLSVEGTTTSEAAEHLKISVPNASTKLKQLAVEGFILRRERVAPTGGIEFEYFRIG